MACIRPETAHEYALTLWLRWRFKISPALEKIWALLGSSHRRFSWAGKSEPTRKKRGSERNVHTGVSGLSRCFDNARNAQVRRFPGVTI